MLLECQFIEKPAHDSGTTDQATQERLIAGESNALDGIEFSDDAVLEALQGADDENGTNQQFDFDFDDSDEQIIEEEALDLSVEMLGSKIQQAAAKIYSLSTLWSI